MLGFRPEIYTHQVDDPAFLLAQNFEDLKLARIKRENSGGVV